MSQKVSLKLFVVRVIEEKKFNKKYFVVIVTLLSQRCEKKIQSKVLKIEKRFQRS